MEPDLVKALGRPPLVVGVIASPADLRAAQRLPAGAGADLLEVRLDAWVDRLDKLEPSLAALPRPLILTARHPREGGAGNLAVGARRTLLLRFIRHAAAVDIELRSRHELREVLTRARELGKTVILSFHDFAGTPPLARLRAKAAAALVASADIFKVATRTEQPAELARLLAFYEGSKAILPLSAMGMGALGRESRLLLGAAGSVLNYGHLSRASVAGQSAAAALRARLAAPL